MRGSPYLTIGIPTSGSARVFIPEGCARIAQRFSVGARRRLWPSPEGTVETARALGRPFGTYFLRQNPTLKRWAIIRCPSGTPACANAIQRENTLTSQR